MRRKKFSTQLTTTLIVFLIFVFVIGFGFLLGYRFIVQQTEKFEAYDAALLMISNDQAGTSDEETSPEKVLSGTDYQLHVIDPDSPNAIMIYVELGDKPSDIAKQLEEKGVIANPTLFVLLSKINGFDDSYLSGTHFVSKDMSYDEIMYTLSRNAVTVSITFTEGMTYNDVKETLTDHGVQYNADRLDVLVDHPELFSEYDCVKNIPLTEDRQYALQGYLFPDTYFYDLNTDEKTILRRFLQNTDDRLLDEHYERAEAIGMTLDEVITLASIIQMESAIPLDMYKVSRVFHNRLEYGDKLQSCATVNYLRRQQGKEPIFIVSEEDMEMDSPYNTYLYEGLPPGPICSPGLEAIHAALYPDIDSPNLYYFVSKGDGENYFSSSYEEHERAVEEYLVPLQENNDDETLDETINEEDEEGEDFNEE